LPGWFSDIKLAQYPMKVGEDSVASYSAEAKMEKCYGVVKSGKNDCSSAKKGGHSCAGEAKSNADKSEWILLPEGICERLNGGSLKASN
jgi:uncharacterized membrane protein